MFPRSEASSRTVGLLGGKGLQVRLSAMQMLKVKTRPRVF